MFPGVSDDTMKMKDDLAIHYPANPLDQTLRFIIFLAALNDLLQSSPGRHGEGRLMDGLIAGIEFGNNEVAGSAKSQHPGSEGIVVGTQSRETRKQSMM
jgi:hypothetical protein